MNRINVGISLCLLGERVRYDGQHKLDRYLRDTMGQFISWVGVCPETECGLPVPREAMRLVGDVQSPRLVTIHTGVDHTDRMKKWCKKKLIDLEKLNLCGFVFKARSPSSGLRDIKVYSKDNVARKKGRGLFASAFIEHFPLLPVEDEGRLHDPVLRENFINRIFIYRHWKDNVEKGSTVKALVDFHSDNKLILMAHSPKHLKVLGQMVAHARGRPFSDLSREYLSVLMEALKTRSTVKKNTNVLQHMAGYFKERLSREEKKELQEVIENYHKSLVPLIVPVTLFNHYVRKYREPYLMRQRYLNPHPMELMLRNHV